MIFAVVVAGVLLSQLSGVAAHGGVLSYSNAGNWYWGFQPYNNPTGQTSIQRPWSSYNPIQDVTVTTLACNDDGTAIPDPLQLTATVQAGSSITAYWNLPWPHNTGPMLTYLALCPGTTCNDVNANTLNWFKISEAGLINGTIFNGTWAAGVMIAQNSTWTTTIPATVPSGPYLIRFETIALHSMPAQNYPECAQINIVGGGNVPPPADILVTFPGAYVQTDPGLTIDIYDQEAETTYNYTIPGPPLYPGTGGGSTPPPTSSSSSTTTSSKSSSSSTSSTSSKASTTSTTTTSTTSTKASTTTTTSAAGPTQSVYGQCGGTGYTGPTVCAAGSTCTVSNQYYSQCLP